ncbi:MAG: pantetheine-phosphate adenylyltransferase [Myxococcales bacterium]|nr:pantetheine-phosphate adenylyltransferase [Myxococcales bacterium]
MTSNPRVAFYPGSFDPITNGHVDIINRGLKIFDRVIVALAQNVSKTALFSLEERKEMIERVFTGERNVDVVLFEGLMVNAAKAAGAPVVLRGLRGITDFEYEFQLATMNKRLLPELETVFLMTERDNFHVSSKLVREVASLGGDVSGLVPALVEEALNVKF